MKDLLLGRGLSVREGMILAGDKEALDQVFVCVCVCIWRGEFIIKRGIKQP